MKDWANVEPDVYAILPDKPQRYTRGRSRPIDRIVIHHNAGVNLTSERLRDEIWLDRPASAHYQVEPNGRIGQLVHDRDTAWHAANADINARSIGIEHANIGGPPRWQISDATIEEGAHLVAALCRYYKLGRPEWGRNVFPHRAYTSTSCPHQLDVGGEDHAHYMARAQFWYDNPTPAPAAPKTAPPKEDTMTPEDRKLLTDIRDLCVVIRDQLTGENGRGGWPQGGKRTLYDLAAAIAEIEGVPNTRDTLG